jgi:hypothetical protein
MDVLILTLIASLALVGVGVLFLVKRILEGDVEHGDRLSLLPLTEDEDPLPPPAVGEGDSDVTSRDAERNPS